MNQSCNLVCCSVSSLEVAGCAATFAFLVSARVKRSQLMLLDVSMGKVRDSSILDKSDQCYTVICTQCFGGREH